MRTTLVAFVGLALFCLALPVIWASESTTPTTAADNKAVNVVLRTKWANSPLHLDASEYLFKESPQQFWSYVDNLGIVSGSDKEQYGKIIKTIVDNKLLSDGKLKHLEMGLSLHYFNPAVAMYQKLIEEEVARLSEDQKTTLKGCNAWVQIGSKVTCDLKTLPEFIKNTEDDGSVVTYDFDHVTGNRAAVQVILYAELGTKEFVEAHKILSAKAQSDEIKYIFRHSMTEETVKKLGNLNLQGYGVELALKNIEYKVIDDSNKEQKEESEQKQEPIKEEDTTPVEGFDFATLKKRFPDLSIELAKFRASLTHDDETDFAHLKSAELKDMAIKAAQKIIDSEEPLQVLRDISSNLPSLAKSIIKQPPVSTPHKSIKNNMVNLGAETNVLLINGKQLDLEETSIFSIFDVLSNEIEKFDQMKQLHMKSKDIFEILTNANAPGNDAVRIKISPDNVFFVNNLETDPRYARWPKDVASFNAPSMYPGSPPYVAKNFYTVVLLIDPTRVTDLEVTTQIISAVFQNFPIRVGLLFYNSNAENEAPFNAFVRIAHHLKTAGVNAFMQFLQGTFMASRNSGVGSHFTLAHFNAGFSRTNAGQFTTVIAGTEHDEAIEAMKTFISDKKIAGFKVFLNGFLIATASDQVSDAVQGDFRALSDLEFKSMSNLQRAFGEQQPIITQMIADGRLVDSSDVYTEMLNDPAVFERFSPYVFTSVEQPLQSVAIHKGLGKQVINNVPLLVNDKAFDFVTPVTMYVIANFSTEGGLTKAKEAVAFLAQEEAPKTRLGFVNCLASKSADAHDRVLANSIRAAAAAFPPKSALPLVQSFLQQELSAVSVASVENLVKDAGLDVEKFKEKYSVDLTSVNRLEQEFCETVVKVNESQAVIIANGRVVALDEDDLFNVDDFGLLNYYEAQSRAKSVLNAVENAEFESVPAEDVTSAFKSDIVRDAVSLLLKGQDELPSIKLGNNVLPSILKSSEAALVQIKAIVNPFAPAAQKIVPILIFITDHLEVDLSLYLNPANSLSHMPLKNYYRYVLEKIQFDEKGNLNQPGIANFHSFLPQTKLLSMNVHPPVPWFVGAIECKYDLDNLVLQDIPKAEKIVNAVYELENILVEGSCGDMSNRGIPPRGLELILGDRNEPHEVDTMVMSNLGYFQLKSSPGVHTLQLSQGRASDIYQIINHNVAVQNQTIVINSFNGAQIQLQVKKRVGKENEKLFVEEEKPNVAEDPSLWSSVANMFGKGTDAEVAQKDETIHVFSLASGHLYERFLKIMMLSVTKHSSKPVKFWLLKNFLSPKFREYVPKMAKAYNFSVELMTFKWPAWLQKQTEKQRIIWGYKILFLDVLFPLDVNKVIYVDADQVVRADLTELWNMDLQGRVYGYTPFCSGDNLREETRGFRFWDTGYWHDYLRGKPYHISALYVVDLWKMRKLGIGDQIRAHYDGLSKDPNSLANLDQDLPNYLQHQIPIFSLPQEWLWCETWCTDESKTKAKTIDMCNNPLTKKPKLENAVRIVEEWTDLDNEAKTLDAILENAKNQK